MVGSAGAADGKDVLDAAGAGALKDLLTIFVKVGEFQVGVGIGEHQTCLISLSLACGWVVD